MDESPNQRKPVDSPQDLPGLVTGLSMLYRGTTQAPRTAADDAVRAAIREHYGGFYSGRKTARWRIVPLVSAAAAAILIAVLWTVLPQRTHQSPAPTSAVARQPQADIDRNGRIDILDAYSLARRLEAIAPSDAAFDLNRDGMVDRLDVDAIAMQAVSLNPSKGASS